MINKMVAKLTEKEAVAFVKSLEGKKIDFDGLTYESM